MKTRIPMLDVHYWTLLGEIFSKGNNVIFTKPFISVYAKSQNSCDILSYPTTRSNLEIISFRQSKFSAKLDIYYLLQSKLTCAAPHIQYFDSGVIVAIQSGPSVSHPKILSCHKGFLATNKWIHIPQKPYHMCVQKGI